MPTVRANIAYAYREFERDHGASARRIAKRVALMLLIALVLEVFVFNINFYASSGYNSVNVNDLLELREPSEGTYLLTEADHVIELTDLNMQVRNVWLDLDYRQPAQQVTIKIQFTDDAHHTYFDTTEYTIGVPEVEVSTLVAQSEYLNLNTSGMVDDLRIEVVGDDVDYPIRLNNVVLNARHPFEFNMTRFLIAAGVLLLACAFRPKSSIYRIGINSHPKFSKGVIIATLVVELFLMSSYMLFGSNLVGVATSGYNSGSWDGYSIAYTFEVGGDNAQQYAELAK